MAIDSAHPVVLLEQGDLIHLGGCGVHYKIPGAVTGGAFSIVEHPVDPGVLIPPHTHTREDEFSFIIEGEIGVRIGDQVFTARPGDYVVKPRRVPHTFWNAGPGMARLLEIISPPQFDEYFREMNRILTEGGEPDFGRISVLADRYGVSFNMDWVPELCSTYGVTVLGN